MPSAEFWISLGVHALITIGSVAFIYGKLTEKVKTNTEDIKDIKKENAAQDFRLNDFHGRISGLEASNPRWRRT